MKNINSIRCGESAQERRVRGGEGEAQDGRPTALGRAAQPFSESVSPPLQARVSSDYL
jgi:hypothetical protein